MSTIPGPDGTLIGATFQLEGQEFQALNGGPQFAFTPAISLFVSCETQAEVDRVHHVDQLRDLARARAMG